jgi:hypothetical protein
MNNPITIPRAAASPLPRVRQTMDAVVAAYIHEISERHKPSSDPPGRTAGTGPAPKLPRRSRPADRGQVSGSHQRRGAISSCIF